MQRSGCAAYTYLLRSSEPYLRDPFYQFSETALDKPERHGDSLAFPFGLYPAFPFLTGAGGFLQAFTHGLTGMRLREDVFYLDPMLPPQIPEGVIIKGIKWQGASFDVSIQLDNTTITRRVLGHPHDKVAVSIQIGDESTENGHKNDMSLKVGESLVVPTRRPDLASSLVTPNKALCKPVTAEDDSWSFGRYPLSAVDGSSATVWQPLTATTPASITVDLGEKRDISGFVINWGASPAKTFTIFGDDIKVYEKKKVKITAPYNPKTVREVKLRQGNMTEVTLPQPVDAQHIRLMIEGTQGEDKHLGATVAEFVIL